MIRPSRAAWPLAAALLTACATPSPSVSQDTWRVPFDTARLIADVSVLSADSMAGRETGTPGGERARRFLRTAISEIGLASFDGYEQRFTFTPRDGTDPLEGVNLVGLVRGTAYPERYLVLSAHYDHLGIRAGEIYNGADDNASGSAGLLALARYFQTTPPRHSIIFLWTDAEEKGLQGARAFVADPPVVQESLLFNVNLDMIGRNERAELYAVGTYHRPWLVPFIERVAADAPLSLLTGHDRPDLPPGDDWTMASDHGPFHAAGIPFIYFGVEDHRDYHRPTDTFENIDPDFYVRAVETVRRALRALDEDAELAARRAQANVVEWRRYSVSLSTAISTSSAGR